MSAPTYMGDSVGRWEGDTLVVDVIGFNDKGWLTGTGTFHSDALHVTERYTRVDKDQIDYVITMEDPNVLTKPWTVNTTLMLREGTRLQEYVCAENNVETAALRENPEGRRSVSSLTAARQRQMERSTSHFSDASRPSRGAPVPEEPTNSRRPSAKVKSRPLPLSDPSFARNPSTRISDPCGRDFCVNPRR